MLVSCSSAQALAALILSLLNVLELSTLSTGQPGNFCFVHLTILSTRKGSWGVGLLSHRGAGREQALYSGRVRGQGGGYVGQMVRLKHMPPAQLHRALPATSCEGHVCTAGPGPCAGLLWGQVGGG